MRCATSTAASIVGTLLLALQVVWLVDSVTVAASADADAAPSSETVVVGDGVDDDYEYSWDDDEEFSCGCCDHGDHEAKEAGSLTDLLVAFGKNAASACPWLLTGLMITVLLQELLDSLLSPAVVRRYMASGGGTNVTHLIQLSFVAAMIGLAMPLCSCGAIPLALALSAAGCAPAAVVAFLTAAQSAGLDSVVITLGVLGWRTAAFRLFGALTLSVAAGVAVGQVVAATSDKKNDNGDDDVDAGAPQRRRTLMSRVLKVYNLLNETWVVLSLGLFATTLAEDRFGAKELMYAAAGVGGTESGDGNGNSGISGAAASFAKDLVARLIVVVGSLPFQLCEHGVVTFAKALEQSGASPGLAQVRVCMYAWVSLGLDWVTD